MEIRSGVNLSTLRWLSGYTGLTSVLYLMGSCSSTDYLLFCLQEKNTHWMTLSHLLLEMICIVFKAMQDFTLLATLESMRTLGTTVNKIVHKIQTLGGFATGFICRCKMIFNTDFMHSSRHILLSGRHLFKQGALMNSLWMPESVWWCVSPHPSIRLCLSSHPCRGWPAWACPQWCWWASSVESVGDYEEAFILPDPSSDRPCTVL